MDISAALVAQPGRRTRRRYSEAFKAQAIQACLQPGVSIASVALANGLNANMLRKWVVDFEQGGATVTRPRTEAKGSAQVPAFVQLPMPASGSTPAAPAPGIFIELQRADTSIYITWPTSEAAACGAWLRELLRP